VARALINLYRKRKGRFFNCSEEILENNNRSRHDYRIHVIPTLAADWTGARARLRWQEYNEALHRFEFFESLATLTRLQYTCGTEIGRDQYGQPTKQVSNNLALLSSRPRESFALIDGRNGLLVPQKKCGTRAMGQ